MKRVIVLLVAVFISLQAPAASAQVMKAEGEVIVVKEKQLIELAGQEKFANLMGVLKKLVQKSLPAEETKKQVVSTEQINILDFKYLSEGRIKIFYLQND